MPQTKEGHLWSGVLQICIKAWLQHLSFLGSWMSCLKTMFKYILRVTPYLISLLKSLVKPLLNKRMKTFYYVCVFRKYELCVVHELINCYITSVFSTLKQSVNHGKLQK
jgi:hypothetical protein